MLTTEEAAKILTARGVLVKGKGTEPHPPTARTVENWCRTGKIICSHIGVGRRGTWLVEEEALEVFTPPMMGRKPKPKQDTHSGKDQR